MMLLSRYLLSTVIVAQCLSTCSAASLWPSPFGIAATVIRGGSVTLPSKGKNDTDKSALQQQQQQQPLISTNVQTIVAEEDEEEEPSVDKNLTDSIDKLTTILSGVVEGDNNRVQKLFNKFYNLGEQRATDTSNKEPLQAMVECAKNLSPDDALGVMRMLTLALNLVNAAENHHKLRLVREADMENDQDESAGPLPKTNDSVRGTIGDLLTSSTNATTKEEIFEQLAQQRVEIVLTAHPTEVNRKTLLRKFRIITETLAYLDRPDLHHFERKEAESTLERTIASIWGSDEIRRRKPSPQQEAAGGNAVIESVLWDAVPAYLRKLNAQCKASLDRTLPVETVPIKFASWIGGDRDGNPNVTPQVTTEVILHQRLRAAKLFLNDLHKLYNELAISSRFSDEMEELAASISNSEDEREKYRRVIGHLRLRLVKTIKECEQELAKVTLTNSTQWMATEASNTLQQQPDITGWENVEPMYESNDLMEPLLVMYRSLVNTKLEKVAEGLLSDIIRRLAVFGMTLVPLDIREESTKHTEALDAITKWLGMGSYKLWDERTKLSWLETELKGKRPLFETKELDDLDFDETVVKTLRTFLMASSQKSESLGAYVISQAQTASDVLAVMLLQKHFGMTSENGKMMRVVPLFETLDDLKNAAKVMEELFSTKAYVSAINGKQEVMVGYSDSAKDAGRLAACWAQYKSQEEMVRVAERYDIELTFFHGKGGTVGRGGNPALYRAIMSHPPNTINGRFRVTEQGEMITQNFGAPAIAERTLDIYTAAVLGEKFHQHVKPTKKWRNQMERISRVSCADYRYLVREEPRFVPYFRQATPELELGRLNIGSRPAKRNPEGGIESLRAIPWTFAWTQTRTHLSAWLGVGAGLTTNNDSDLDELQDMYENWPWFKETIDLIRMIISKTDFSISKNYDDQLVNRNGDELLELGEEVRKKMVDTREAIMKVTNSTDLARGPHRALIMGWTKIRHPYVDPINVMQAELLKRLRSTMEDEHEKTPEQLEEKKRLEDALIVSINGIAQGMRNSG